MVGRGRETEAEDATKKMNRRNAAEKVEKKKTTSLVIGAEKVEVEGEKEGPNNAPGPFAKASGQT